MPRIHKSRFLALRCGATLGDANPAMIQRLLGTFSRDDLASIRAGAFFVVLDEFSKKSDV